MSFRRLLGCLASVALATATLGMVTSTGASAMNTSLPLTRYPYLTNLVGTKVTVNWATDRSLGSTTSFGYVKWAPATNGSCPATLSNIVKPPTTSSRTNLAIGPTGSQTLEYQWKVTLDVGAPGTYCYRVFYGNGKVPDVDLLGADPSPQFTTQAGPGEPFSFAVLGDWGQVDPNGQNPNEAAILGQIANSGVRFAISTGDNAYNNGSQNDYGDLQQTVIPANPGNPSAVPRVPATPQTGMSAVFGPSFWAVAGKSIPMFAGIGNHGFARNDAIHPHIQNWPQDDAVASSNGSYKVETYPPTIYGTTQANLPSLWYAFDAGGARFYMLETAWPDNNVGSAPGPAPGYANDYEAHWKPGDAEYDWLKADLQAHPNQMKFAFFHKPLVSDANTNWESSDTYLRADGPNGNQSLEALLAQNGVALAFNGHAHIYERNNAVAGNPNTLVSYVTGGGGGTVEPVKQTSCDPRDAYAVGWSPTNNVGSSCGSAHAPSSPAQVFNFLKVDVNGTNVTVTPYDLNGNTFDVQTYNFNPTPQPPATAGPAAGYIVDGYGGLQSFAVGGAKPLGPTHGGPYWAGWNIARGVALLPDHTGGYVLDGFGGLHGFAIGSNPMPPAVHGAPYWNGWDIARGLTINSTGTGGYIVDGYGGLHAFSIGSGATPPAPTGGPYWKGINIARGVTLLPGDAGGYIVDGWGGIHTFGTDGHTAAVPKGGPYWPGWDIVRGITTTPDGKAGYVLDGFGAAHAFQVSALAPGVTAGPYWNGWDIARGSSF